ncbi:MAG: DNA/RNA non-specific endonuclease [Rikenellaceae bacterium]
MIKRGIAAAIIALLSTTIVEAKYTPKSTGELIVHTHFSLDYNEHHEQPNWVYYTLTKENLSGGEERSNSFKADPKVSTGSAVTADYAKSGYDRGHLCPAADMTQSQTAMRETFYMSNMSPQAPSCNRGIWKTSETYVRNLVAEPTNKIDTLYIVTGPIFNNNMGAIGANNVTIPGAYYKVAYSPQISKMWAFIIPNEKSDNTLEFFRTTVDEVELQTGIDLYYQLPPKLQEQLEAQK